MREQAQRWLATAPLDELIVTVQEAPAARADGPGDDTHDYVLGIALAVREGKDWELSMAGERAAAAYPEGVPGGEPWCQFGACENCGLEVVAATKRAICPHCRAVVRLT